MPLFFHLFINICVLLLDSQNLSDMNIKNSGVILCYLLANIHVFAQALAVAQSKRYKNVNKDVPDAWQIKDSISSCIHLSSMYCS
jgi:hypothetical protein